MTRMIIFITWIDTKTFEFVTAHGGERVAASGAAP